MDSRRGPAPAVRRRWPFDTERFLIAADRPVITLRRHPAKLLIPLVRFAGAVLLAGFVTRLVGPGVLADLAWYVALAMLAWLLWEIAQWAADRLYITQVRIIETSGIFTRHVAMMPYRKVTDMRYDRSAGGHLLGYGTFVLESAGQTQAIRHLSFVPKPDWAYHHICERAFGRKSPPDEGD